MTVLRRLAVNEGALLWLLAVCWLTGLAFAVLGDAPRAWICFALACSAWAMRAAEADEEEEDR
jgi:hypothetical protein